jgi:hypothetical protein
MAQQALREHASYTDFLAELLERECEDHDERRKVRRVKEANFPRQKRIEDFDFSKNPNVSPEVVNTLATTGWVNAGQPLCLIGDSGTGKSHLLIGIGTAVAEAGGRVRYTTAANLVNELAEAADDKLGRTIKKYGRIDLLCLDDWDTSSSTATAPNCCSRFSPSGKNATRSRSPPTGRSPSGTRPSPTSGSARRSSTASPSRPTSSRPGPSPSAWPAPQPSAKPQQPHDQGNPCRSGRARRVPPWPFFTSPTSTSTRIICLLEYQTDKLI